jgi:antitoxin ParD1/3/4
VHYDRFVRELIESGRYRNASEVMRSGLRLLEQKSCEEREKLRLLRSLAAEGLEQLDQGQGIEVHNETQLAARIGRIGRRAEKSAKRKAAIR